MEITIKITIFLFFVSVTLITNTVIIWLGYRLFANMTNKMAAAMNEFRAGGAGREWLEKLEAASAQVATATQEIRIQLVEAEPALAEAHSKLQFGLAKADIRMERLCNKVVKGTEIAQETLIRPATRIGSIAAGVREVLSLFVQSEPDATSTLRR